MGKKMSDQLPFAMAWWHNLCANGIDMFGRGTIDKIFGSEPDGYQAYFLHSQLAIANQIYNMKRGFVMKKKAIIGIIISAVIYLVLFVLGAASGAIHPACYAYVGTVMPVLFAFLYLYTASNMRCFGAATALNGFALVIAFAAGEGNLTFAIIMLLLTALSEVLRAVFKYDTLKGVMWGFIPFAFSFYAYTFHWWTDTAEALEEAVEIMPEGYADKMEAVIHNIPGLIIALVLVIPVAFFGMKLAEKLMKRSTAQLA